MRPSVTHSFANQPASQPANHTASHRHNHQRHILSHSVPSLLRDAPFRCPWASLAEAATDARVILIMATVVVVVLIWACTLFVWRPHVAADEDDML